MLLARMNPVSDKLSYKTAGVDIDAADDTKRSLAQSLESGDARVLNRLGAFASLFSADFPGVVEPVLVLKMEEPGSKQKLAFEHGRIRSICFDLINHLVNDIAVMGAAPLAVQDTIVCGRLEKETVCQLVAGMAEACREQECSLVGGETSEQPGVVPAGTYILAASMLGVVDKSKIIDGSRVACGDTVLALASNGLHTNGYSLVRALIGANPAILQAQIAGESFLDAILRPHLCYYRGLRGVFNHPALHALAHITGGGIEGNLNRVIPHGLCARIDLRRIEVLPIFHFIQESGRVEAADMLRTFNMGAGLMAVCAPQGMEEIIGTLAKAGFRAYPVGIIEAGAESIAFEGAYS